MRKRRNAVGLLVVALAAAMLAGTVQALVPSDPQASHPTYAALNLPAAWDLTTGSPRVIIAIVDTGIDPTHPDLVGSVRIGRDFVDRDDDATNPPGGHGTAVAGVAAARANNGVGGIGTCFSCELMSLRVLGLDGIALNTNTAAAIVRARAAGVLVVAAAGNEGTAEPQYPAAFPETISVGAAATSTSLARYSSFGSWLEFAAPECAPITSIGGGTDVGCATSIASLLVAGTVALLRTQAPFATADELESALARTAGPTPGTRHGLVDAAAALAALGRPEPHLQPVSSAIRSSASRSRHSRACGRAQGSRRRTGGSAARPRARRSMERFRPATSSPAPTRASVFGSRSRRPPRPRRPRPQPV